MRNQCTRVLKMYPEQWERLDQLAKETNSRPRKGLDAHQVTWLALIRRIADGELQVVDPKPYPMPEGLAQAADALEPVQRQEHEQARKPRPVKLKQLSLIPEPV